MQSHNFIAPLHAGRRWVPLFVGALVAAQLFCPPLRVPVRAQERPAASPTPAVSHDDHQHMQHTAAPALSGSWRTFVPIVQRFAPPDPDTPITFTGTEPVAPDWLARCPADTVPFEAQAWWTDDFGHVHAGFCAPQNLTITGKYTFKVRLMLHGNPGKLTLLQGQLDDSKYGGQTVTVNLTCPRTTTCGWDREVTVDTAAFPNDGWHTIRIRAVVREPDGKELVATNFIPVYFRNGKPVQDSNSINVSKTTDYIAGRGWYTDRNYIWSAIFDPPRASTRISGVYKLRVRPLATDNPLPISRFIVKLDATHSAPGTVIYDAASPSSTPVELSIDTTKLENGWHSLLARTESAGQPSTGCADCSGQTQTQAGVSKIWFYVENEGRSQ